VIEAVVQGFGARVVEAVAGDHRDRRRCATAVEVDRLGGALAGIRAGAVKGGEGEVAGVEDAGGL
jgi:hypothetical protein